MVVALVVCALVVVALVIALVRLRTRVDELGEALSQARDDTARARAEAAEVDRRAEALTKARDDAFERVNRARRDAAEVANRLRDETALRAETEAALQAARLEVTEAREAAEVAAAEAAAAVASARTESADDPDPALAATMWALALRQVEHTWRVSIALGPEAETPFDGSDDLFRTAVEIEVEAAREEAGADIELVWAGDDTPTTDTRAALAWALLRDVIATLGTTASSTTLTVSPGGDGVDIVVAARDDDGRPLPVVLPEALQVGDGHALVP